MRKLTRNRGFTLLEVLIAVLIFTLGLLGVAGLMVLSVRTNHSAYLRTQASFLAQSMVDRMRSNVGWANDYNGTYDASTVGAGACTSGICSPSDLVTRDTQIWSQQLFDMLNPNFKATIDCNGTYGESATARGSGAEPFDGICSMVITWNEADLSRSETPPAGTQTFAWVFQP